MQWLEFRCSYQPVETRADMTSHDIFVKGSLLLFLCFVSIFSYESHFEELSRRKNAAAIKKKVRRRRDGHTEENKFLLQRYNRESSHVAPSSKNSSRRLKKHFRYIFIRTKQELWLHTQYIKRKTSAKLK